MRIIPSKKFERAYKKYAGHSAEQKQIIQNIIANLSADPFSPQLKTHKLSDKLKGLFACSCGYDCRIVFSLEEIEQEQIIILIDIGSHEKIY
ncbi:MAG: type II toxin-antitoxin system YafQ family toxin [Ignavibacteriae bacterium]|nr:type II toxin-antitoxin system YafQ family toxin [Ignavibacteriota bacterium]